MTHVGAKHAAPKRRPGRIETKRTDVQALRAIAVTAVVGYHLWPNRLTGGYAGVDVFFVISGFLITSHLLAHPPDRLSDLLDFWSRRIRRLLPAALLVLAVVLIASRLFAPSTQWDNTAVQTRAAALYAINWRLAHDAVNYLASQNAPSPVQHYWSLAVEEQFYLIWPVLILVLILAARAARLGVVPVVFCGLSAATAWSLWYSVHYTASNPAAAYFVTPTRVWELGIGGVLAVLVAPRAFGVDRPRASPLPAGLRTALVWSGLAAMTIAFVRYNATTAFPGWHALAPTLGAAAVIAAADPRSALTPGRLFALAPVEWLGDVSYSIYLWHWPLVVLVPTLSGHLGILDKATIIAVTLVLAAVTKRFVEDPFRRPRWGRPAIKPFVVAAVGMAVVVAGVDAQIHEVVSRQAAQHRKVAEALEGHDPCIGAAALSAGAQACPPVTRGKLTPDPLAAKEDRPVGFPSGSGGGRNCFALQPSFHPVVCTFGAATATIHVALAGNSHAYQFLPALQEIAAEEGWQITTYIAQRCVYGAVLQADDVVMGSSSACSKWGAWVTAQLTSHDYDVVVLANRAAVGVAASKDSPTPNEYAAGYATVIKSLRAAKEKVVGIRDSPAPGISIPDCLGLHPNDYSVCDGTRAKWLAADPLTAAIASVNDDGVIEADLTDHICEPVTCPAVVGDVPAYFDNSHLSATFARTLAPYLLAYLRAALR